MIFKTEDSDSCIGSVFFMNTLTLYCEDNNVFLNDSVSNICKLFISWIYALKFVLDLASQDGTELVK